MVKKIIEKLESGSRTNDLIDAIIAFNNLSDYLGYKYYFIFEEDKIFLINKYKKENRIVNEWYI